MTEAERAALAEVADEPIGSRRAAAALAELRQKLRGAQERLAEIDAERERRAFDGMLERGGTPNRRSLDKLRSDGRLIEDEIKDLTIAVQVGEQRLASARAAAAETAAIQEARYVVDEVCGTLRSEASAAGDALIALRQHVEKILKAANELRARNYGPPTRSIELQIARAITTSLIGLRVTDGGFLAPSSRVTMPALAESICQSVEGTARRVIGGDQGEAA
jgi:hypothetical protein